MFLAYRISTSVSAEHRQKAYVPIWFTSGRFTEDSAEQYANALESRARTFGKLMSVRLRQYMKARAPIEVTDGKATEDSAEQL
jgi:hypothetical protein